MWLYIYTLESEVLRENIVFKIQICTSKIPFSFSLLSPLNVRLELKSHFFETFEWQRQRIPVTLTHGRFVKPSNWDFFCFCSQIFFATMYLRGLNAVIVDSYYMPSQPREQIDTYESQDVYKNSHSNSREKSNEVTYDHYVSIFFQLRNQYDSVFFHYFFLSFTPSKRYQYIDVRGRPSTFLCFFFVIILK